ncbi:Hsp20/alpha crystallin family protein [Ferrimonas pelagia]|uniref:SHSP domain-containing protein n=1 Tax=Ferrimonas pelagia TaxID=1177826 RepID=A0ABP9FL84_9GAMM
MRRGSLSLFDPGSALDQWHNPFGRLLDDLEQPWPFGATRAGRSDLMVPAVDMKERKDQLEISADLPGLAEADIELQCYGDRLLLTVKRERETQTEKEEGYHLVERQYGTYQRMIALPFVVTETDPIRASYRDGVLRVTIYKPADAQAKQKVIKINVDH